MANNNVTMMKYSSSDDFVDKLRAQADIVSIVAEYVSLKKQGRNYWGCCPFHQEKTPSFSVAPDKGFFYCFGCQKGGNVFNFLMGVENVGFGDAVKLLAQKLNIPLPERERSEAERQREKEREDILRANELARDFFSRLPCENGLWQSGTFVSAGKGFIHFRRLKTFRLGYAPDAWEKLSSALQGRGILPETLVKAGLAIARTPEGIYDRFSQPDHVSH